jgi:hypothetical protein
MRPLKDVDDKKAGDYLIIPFSNFREQVSGSSEQGSAKRKQYNTISV